MAPDGDVNKLYKRHLDRLTDQLPSTTQREEPAMAETGNTRKRFKGELTLANVQEEAAVKRSSADLTEYTKIVQASWEKVQNKAPNPAFGMVIPAEGATRAENLFRSAASELGLGVSIQVYEHDSAKGREKGLTPGQAWLSVQSREKKAAPNRKNNRAANGAAKTTGGLPKPPARAK